MLGYVMSQGNFFDTMKGERVMYAEKFWDYLNVSYSSNNDNYKTPMSYWLKQLDKIQEDYNIIPNNINIDNSRWERSIFDILFKRLHKFARSPEKTNYFNTIHPIRTSKVYTYDIINEIVVEP